jgi:hypothetical protein
VGVQPRIVNFPLYYYFSHSYVHTSYTKRLLNTKTLQPQLCFSCVLLIPL